MTNPEAAEVLDVIVRERIARDGWQWDEMASFWDTDSLIEVSWFKGNGPQFVEATRKGIRPDNLNFHQLCPGTATVKGDRAIADMPCVLQSFSRLDDLEVNQAGHAHLLWRARRSSDGWKLAGLRAYYVRDSLTACNPTQVPKLDDAKLARYRLSYRYLCYILDSVGGQVHDDLPGVDRPETVRTLIAAENAWLAA